MYCMVRWSTGKKPIVAPYSGAMLANVCVWWKVAWVARFTGEISHARKKKKVTARSSTDKCATPSPKNSTNLPTTS